MSKRFCSARTLVLAALMVVVAKQGTTDVVVENERVRAVIGSGGMWRSLVDKGTGTDWCCQRAGVRFAEAIIEGKRDRAASIEGDGSRFRVGFGGSDTVLVYETVAERDWLIFRLVAVEGARPSRLTMVRLGVTQTTNVGPRLNIAWDDRVAICLMCANHRAFGAGRRRTQGAGDKRFTYADLRGYTQDAPGPRLEGAAMALILCDTADLRNVLHRASVQFDLLTNTRDGVPVKYLPEAKQSYWFMSLAESDAEKMINYCKKTGFKQVMMGFGSWGASVGHYPIKLNRYPDGKESLKRFVDKLHAEGVLVGMHTFASKISKRDAYVTPVPDKRFWKDMEMALAEAVTAEQTAIPAREPIDQWPGSPVCRRKSWEGGVRKHQEVILGDEIVQYESIGPAGKWDTFTGCKRGAWGTRAAAHRAGDVGYHFGVDGCINGYIIDQETDLIDEATRKLTDVFNYCGFDMIYFDGGEDVDRRRFYYYVTKHQEATMRKIRKRPIVHCGTIMTHRLWHSFARSGTVDHYTNTLRGHIVSRGAKWLGNFMIEYPDGTTRKWCTVKEHIDKSVRRTIQMGQDLMPSELGWFGIWPRSRYSDGLQLDEAEYLMVKSLAYDVPISLQTSFRSMEAHPLTPQILQIVKTYEGLRASGTVDVATRDRLKEMGRDYILIQSGEAPEFVPVQEMPEVGGTHHVRAFVGDHRGGAVASLWHYVKDGKLTLAGAPNRLRVTSFMGQSLRSAPGDGAVTLDVNSWRTTLFFEGMRAEEAREILSSAQFLERQPVKIWVQAESFVRAEGEMTKGSAVGVEEADALGDVVVCTGRTNFRVAKQWYCEYQVDIPRSARWTIWGRVRYPSGADESFGLVPDGEEVTLQGQQVLGNCGVNETKWHWTGRGSGVATVPPGARITRNLSKGRFTFRVLAREAGGSALTNPRLDCICLCDDPDYLPTDEDAAAALK